MSEERIPDGFVPVPEGSGWFGYSSSIEAIERYGLSWEDYNKLLTAQDGHCAICGHPDVIVGPLVIDHDHGTGHVRGLLCQGCNTGLGNFRDDPVLLDWAAQYLRERGSDPVRAEGGDEPALSREMRRHEERPGPRPRRGL